MIPSQAISVAAGFCFFGLLSSSGQDASKSDVPPVTVSADDRFGVTVPPSDTDDRGTDTHNAIVEIKSGKKLGVINGDVTFQHMNHDEVVPSCWTPDDSKLMWLVNGKWGTRKAILISLKDGKIARQTDILDLLQKEILKRTQAARPRDYAAVKLQGTGDGSWFKDGFGIDVVFDADAGKLKFPLTAHVFLTSDVKGESEDKAKLDSRLNAEVNQDGTIKVSNFYVGQDPPARTWEH